MKYERKFLWAAVMSVAVAPYVIALVVAIHNGP